jgi:hypothetical protein
MEVLTVNGKNYVKASAAARDLGYTADYVGQLCRSGKVDAILVGRSWYVCKDSIKGHKSTRYRSTQTKSKESIQKVLVQHQSSAKATSTLAYDTDDAELFPVVKKTGVIDVELADAVPVKIKSQTEKYAFQTTELPTIKFQGSLKVHEIEEGEETNAEQDQSTEVAPDDTYIIHPTLIRDDGKKAKNIAISDIPVRIIKTETSTKKLTVLSEDGMPIATRSVITTKETEEVEERSVFTPIVSFVSLCLGSLVVLCLLGLQSHVTATASSLTTSYSFDIDHLTASAYSAIEHSQNFLYLAEFSTSVLIF